MTNDAGSGVREGRTGAFTPGPWQVWEGHQYVGGGADLCIGAGEEWLANMDHRQVRCQQINDDGHFDGENCDICTIDSGDITAEQRANAFLIAAAPDMHAILVRLDALWAEDFPDGPNGQAVDVLMPETLSVWRDARVVIAKAEPALPEPAS